MTRMWNGALGVALGLALTASAVEAQSTGGVKFVVGGGYTLALGDFGDVANGGPHGVVGVEFAPANFPVGIRVDGMYHRVSLDDAVTFGADVDQQFITGTANAVYNFSVAPETKIRPYLIGGIGAYNGKLTGDDADVFGDESVTDFGINAGAGFDYRASETFGIFLEARFHNIFTEDNSTQYLPISVGARIGG